MQGRTMITNISSNRIGIVSFKSTSHCGVILDGKEYLCQISSRVKLSQSDMNTERRNQVSAGQMENLIVVGDRVNVLVDQRSQPMIVERLPRHNQLSRSSSSRPGGAKIEQLLASNVDQVIAVFTATNPEPKWNLLDRYLTKAEGVELPVWIVITKTDLVDQQHALNELKQHLAVYQKIGYPVLLTSCVQQNGIDELRSMLKQKTLS
jgi:ribosome biogenesis GTPase